MTYPRFGLQFCRSRKIVGKIASMAVTSICFVMLAGGAAQAFTFHDQPSTGSSNNSANFSDPASRTKSRMTGDSGDGSTIRNGNTTLQFGTRQSSGQRSPADRYFSPDVLMGR